MKPLLPLAVTMGDPAGIGPETILRAFALLSKRDRNRIVVFGDRPLFTRLACRFGLDVKVVDPKEAVRGDDCLRVRHLGPARLRKGGDFGRVDPRFGEAAMTAVAAAADAVTAGECAALVTAPINKESANRAGYKIAGHTEFLAQRAGGVPVAMMLANDELRVVVATTHIPLADVPKKVTKKLIVGQLAIIDASLRRYGIAAPRIAVAGLNPHASDGGTFGDQEARIVAPAVAEAVRRGIDATGPYPADTLFAPAARKKYDVALALYHDQGLIPVKALGFGSTVNVTLGLPYLRVSVDHGTAFDIAGKGLADGRPMAHAIRTAFRMLSGRM